MLAAVLISTHYLVADGTAPEPWLRQREAYIRKTAQMLPAPKLPVVYHLDADFVVAARTRKSIEVVDDCGDALCGVATDELPRWWEVADARALATPADATRRDRDAFAAAITGWFGDDVDAVAADELRAGVFAKWSDVANEDDELVSVPAAASLIRTLDPERRVAFANMRERLANLSAGDEKRWLDRLRRIAPAPSMKPLLPLHGATLSVVNLPDRSTISNASRQQIATLRATGYGAISLLPFASQGGSAAVDLKRLAHSPGSETDLAMLLPAAQAHARGMHVMLKPHVWNWPEGDATRVDPGPGRWPLWFAAYREFLTHEALLARAAHAEWLCIGTELTRSESRPEWRPLIARIRALYHGGVTYAANFDQFERTPFWRELDAIGIDAYFPLSSNQEASDDELRAGATKIVERIEAVANANGKPAILTELGYANVHAPWVEPWTEPRTTPDPAEQARAFLAMLETALKSRAIAGFFIWKYESDPAVRKGTGFHPQDQPAEGVIKRFLR